jgi:hypothetical protein
MAYRQLSQKDQARQQYDQTVARMKDYGVGFVDARRFRAEAEKVLGIADKKN